MNEVDFVFDEFKKDNYTKDQQTILNTLWLSNILIVKPIKYLEESLNHIKYKISEIVLKDSGNFFNQKYEKLIKQFIVNIKSLNKSEEQKKLINVFEEEILNLLQHKVQKKEYIDFVFNNFENQSEEEKNINIRFLAKTLSTISTFENFKDSFNYFKNQITDEKYLKDFCNTSFLLFEEDTESEKFIFLKNQQFSRVKKVKNNF